MSQIEPKLGSDTGGQTGQRPAAATDAFVQVIPRDFARLHLIMSSGCDDQGEHLVISDRTDPCVPANVGVALGRSVTTTIADDETIARQIDAAYGASDRADSSEDETTISATPAASLDTLLATADRDLLTTQGKGPIVQLVDTLLFDAIGRGASDVHVQPLADRAIVRYRTDGVLHSVRELPREIALAVVSRIKVMGRMDIAERRVPQDGRANVTIGSEGADSRSIDLRISTLPTSYGERAVIRLLESSTGAHLSDYTALGMPAEVATRFEPAVSRSNGIVLVTGPTGSGKTTTLYATLRVIAERTSAHNAASSVGGDLNVMTIEDPIEYELSTVGLAISQAQVNPKKGVTFAAGLRHILRQDPDVIMIGEIRDVETARIAIQSSLTGHLVLSTLHTNDAASAVTRLIDLGVEPYLVSASLEAVLAQRLVRRSCAACSGAGCETCFDSGLRGRVGLFELLIVTSALRKLIATNATADTIRDAARAAGMRTLRQEGERLVSAGLTSEIEVARVVQAELEAIEAVEGGTA